MTKQMNMFSIISVAFVVVAVISLRLLPFAFDDAYIHFRIAENFARDGMPYFNSEQPVMGTSSPVWTYVLTLLALTHISLPIIVALLNSGLTVLGAVVWSRLLDKIVDRPFSKMLLWIFSSVYVGILLPSSAGLMETPLAMLLVAWACLLLLNKSPFAWTVIVIGVFTRYELVVFVFFVGVLQFVSDRRHLFRNTICFLLPFVLLSLSVLLLFSTLVPQPVSAKQIVYSLSRESVFHNAFYSLVPKLDYPILGIHFGVRAQHLISAGISWAWVAGVFFFAGLTFYSLPLSEFFQNVHQRWVLCIGITGVMIMLAYILKRVFLHAWYAPLFCIPIVFFFFATSRMSLFATLAALGLAVLPSSTLVEYSMAAVGYTHILRTATSGARVQRYMEVGSVLNRIFPTARLMTSEIGGLGYSFRGELLDGVGLITPNALKYHPLTGAASGIGGIPADFVRNMSPELIVSYPVFLKDFKETDISEQYLRLQISAFSDEYSIRSGADSIWGCDKLYIYIRRDVVDHNKTQILKKDLGATLAP
ncbi:MAG: hypothetical protein U9Q82_04570 [Chloroflexota bacterium]|nr:hypothetical protein [Chloroflexota bacterium]